MSRSVALPKFHANAIAGTVFAMSTKSISRLQPTVCGSEHLREHLCARLALPASILREYASAGACSTTTSALRKRCLAPHQLATLAKPQLAAGRRHPKPQLAAGRRHPNSMERAR